MDANANSGRAGRDFARLERELDRRRVENDTTSFDAIRLHYACRRGFSLAALVVAAFFINDVTGHRWDNEPDNILFYSQVLSLITTSAASCWAWIKQSPSLRSSRRWTRLCLFSIVFFLGAFQYSELRYFADIVVGTTDRDAGLSDALADSFSLRWGIAILIYILFVPHSSLMSGGSIINPGRSTIPWTIARSSMLAIAIGIVPITITSIFYKIYGYPDRAWSLNSEMAIWIFASAGVAIYAQIVFETAFRGERIAGTWEIIKKISEGGFGAVYLAKHRGFEQRVVLKFPTQMPNLAYFEAVAMGKLSHPNIVNIYYFDKGFKQKPYIVMEYIDGVTLENIIDNHYLRTGSSAMEPARVVYLLRQICLAVQSAHNIDVLHLDIKPNNIMMTNHIGYFDFVKVLDFGISHDANQPSPVRDTINPGTRGYSSPEQVVGNKLDPRADIFSIGSLGHYLLTGNCLQTFPDAPDQHGSYPLLGSLSLQKCPDDLNSIVAKCTQHDRNHRFANAAALIDALDKTACAHGWTNQQADAWWESIVPPTPPHSEPLPTTKSM